MDLILIFITLGVAADATYCFGQEQQVVPRSNNALLNYVTKPDSTFQWQNYQQVKTADGTYYEMNLLSQTWHHITWEHRLIIYIPFEAEYPNTLAMVLQHIYNRNAGLASLKIISDSTSTPAAILYDVPNQPLFDGKEEDDLQAYTFSQYIKSGDESWPLLFPMVKSVVRAMDAIQHLTRKENKSVIHEFVIAGHSKRGHTAWLTAAGDTRVKGIIPIAIDILNSAAQLPHHLEIFGEYSTPSKAATDFLQELRHPRGKRLVEMVDAYSYKEQLTLPKLIVSATNDQFFTTDALNLYWNDLEDPKWILYLSNANHVSAYSDPRVNSTAFAFVRAVASKKALPNLTWKYEQGKNVIQLKVIADTSATKAQVWISYAKSKDFRQCLWTSQPMRDVVANTMMNNEQSIFSKEFKISVEIPLNGYIAVFGEVEFKKNGRRFLQSTQIHIGSRKSN